MGPRVCAPRSPLTGLRTTHAVTCTTHTRSPLPNPHTQQACTVHIHVHTLHAFPLYPPSPPSSFWWSYGPCNAVRRHCVQSPPGLLASLHHQRIARLTPHCSPGPALCCVHPPTALPYLLLHTRSCSLDTLATPYARVSSPSSLRLSCPHRRRRPLYAVHTHPPSVPSTTTTTHIPVCPLRPSPGPSAAPSPHPLDGVAGASPPAPEHEQISYLDHSTALPLITNSPSLTQPTRRPFPFALFGKRPHVRGDPPME